jgi:hypothetical protein
MKRVDSPGTWHLYEFVMTGLMTVCAALLGICAALMWSYFPIMAAGINSSSVTKYDGRIEAALSALQQQQSISNSALDAIKGELRALNEKAGKAAEVTLPQ